MWGYSVYLLDIYITWGEKELKNGRKFDVYREPAGQRINPDPFRIVQKMEQTYGKQ